MYFLHQIIFKKDVETINALHPKNIYLYEFKYMDIMLSLIYKGLIYLNF